MRQYITQEQYEELTNEQRQKYIAWVLSKQLMDYKIGKDTFAEVYRSIGHLIWFLDENGRNWQGLELHREMDSECILWLGTAG
jgi:hypothetical protein